MAVVVVYRPSTTPARPVTPLTPVRLPPTLTLTMLELVGGAGMAAALIPVPADGLPEAITEDSPEGVTVLPVGLAVALAVADGSAEAVVEGLGSAVAIAVADGVAVGDESSRAAGVAGSEGLGVGSAHAAVGSPPNVTNTARAPISDWRTRNRRVRAESTTKSPSTTQLSPRRRGDGRKTKRISA